MSKSTPSYEQEEIFNPASVKSFFKLLQCYYFSSSPNMLYRSHWWGDGGALEGAKDEEEAGGQGDRELRHEPGDCDHDDLHHVDDHKGRFRG